MNAEIIPFKEPRALAGLAARPPAVFLPNKEAAERFFGFFMANHQNKHTRRAYYKAACRFADWCEGRGLEGLADVKPPHVAAYVEWLGRAEPEGQGLSKPTVKQHLAAPRMLFDWLVVGHVVDVNPAHAVRGPKYSQKKGKTPLLDREEARALIAAIDTGSLTGLRPSVSAPSDRSRAARRCWRGRAAPGGDIRRVQERLGLPGGGLAIQFARLADGQGFLDRVPIEREALKTSYMQQKGGYKARLLTV